MKFISTRSHRETVNIIDAITQGLAPDGGLYVPTIFPTFHKEEFLSVENYNEFAFSVLKPFFKNTSLESLLWPICENAWSFPTLLTPMSENTYLLELFHGPTLSFKDYGAQFLASVLSELSKEYSRTVFVATSGDTGSAVACSFFEKPHIHVVVLFPKGKITERQQKQITCWGKNIIAVAVEGTFDDCQNLVKLAFQNPSWERYHLTSANSINVGRLLPQVIYYAYSSLQFYNDHHTNMNFIVPSGNLGNVTAAYWAKRMGFPINKIAIACNANRVLPDYLQSGHFQPQASKATLANAMDVGNPSNFERLSHLFKHHVDFKNNVIALSVSDQDIQETITTVYQHDHRLICPHTATAYFMRLQLPKQEPWTVVATADPAKFETVIEPLLNVSVPVPPRLQEMLSRPQQVVTIPPSLQELQKRMI
ncbi:MAG: threonine synthase [Coxiella sp. RIFCSPHIGHO2_12_FULL_44_14]|nr:MAG: threonine synthase [Coxiella sp. RIFCSPHIGHO2_12_FULL_44_14]